MKILVLNSGSSSQKACLYGIGDSLPKHPPAIAVKSANGGMKKTVAITSKEQVVRELLSTAWSGDTRVLVDLSEIDAVGHRVVHRGPQFEDPVMITPEVRSAIAGVSAFAPLHIRSELEGMEI